MSPHRCSQVQVQGILTVIDPYIFLVSHSTGPLAAFRARFLITTTTAYVLVMSRMLKACSEGLYQVIRNVFGYILISSRGGWRERFHVVIGAKSATAYQSEHCSHPTD